MNSDLGVSHKLKVIVKIIESSQAKVFCQSNAVLLPKWLASITSPHQMIFAACIDNEDVGIVAIRLSNTSNVHIDGLLVNDGNNFQAIGLQLLTAIENYFCEQEFSSLTIETKGHEDKNFNLCVHAGYKPLFDVGETDKILYLQKTISLNDFEFIDLTHTLSAEIPHWGLDVGFKYNARFIQGTETATVKFRVQHLEMAAGIGTHMDAPAHCFEKGLAIDTIPIQSLITRCQVIDVSDKADEHYSVTPDDIAHFENEYGTIPEGAFVIIYTGWSQRWKQSGKYRNEKVFPHISVEAAKVLLSRNIVGIGVDTLSPDAYGSDFPVHSLMLGAGKYMIENVANAEQLDPVGNFIFALPIKIADGTEAPMRLVGMKRK